MATVAKVGNGGSVQVFATSKGYALWCLTYNGARNVRGIKNFFWRIEAHFEPVDIEHAAQKISNASFPFIDIVFVQWCRRCDDVKPRSDPITTWDRFKKELKKHFHVKDAEYEARAKL